jgi:hypothetical protein
VNSSDWTAIATSVLAFAAVFAGFVWVIMTLADQQIVKHHENTIKPMVQTMFDVVNRTNDALNSYRDHSHDLIRHGHELTPQQNKQIVHEERIRFFVIGSMVTAGIVWWFTSKKNL